MSIGHEMLRMAAEALSRLSAGGDLFAVVLVAGGVPVAAAIAVAVVRSLFARGA